MIRWRCFVCVFVISPLPLLAADQFPARPKSSDRVAAQSPPAQGTEADIMRERVLVLNDGTVHRGLIEKTMTGYVLAKPQGRLVFSQEQVRLFVDDLATAHRELSKTCLDQAPARTELSRWCMANGLYDEARKEARRALLIEPDSQIAKNLLQKLDEKLLATTREIPRVKMLSDGSVSMLGDNRGLATIEPLGGLPRSAAQEFTAKIQPLFVNRCATAGCHGISGKQEFQLHRIKAGQRSQRSQVEHNLSAVLDQIDRDRPLNSPLLIKLRGEQRANGLRIPHGGLTPDQTQTIRRWILSVANKSEDDLSPLDEPTNLARIPAKVEAPTVLESAAESEIPEQNEPLASDSPSSAKK